jgi:hypothetical protein
MKPAQHKKAAMEALRELLGEPKLVGLRKKGRVWRGKAPAALLKAIGKEVMEALVAKLPPGKVRGACPRLPPPPLRPPPHRLSQPRPPPRAGKGRRMEFRVGSKADDGKVVLKTAATAVAMDGVAAGSGGTGGVFHGRFGDGVTLSLDLAVSPPPTAGGGLGFEAKDPKTWTLFHGSGASERGIGEAARITKGIAAKAEKKKPKATDIPWSSDKQNPKTSKKARREARREAREAREAAKRSK